MRRQLFKVREDTEQIALFPELDQKADFKAMNLPHFENPQNDNERLLNYQYDFLVNHKELALNGLFTLGLVIARKYINKEAQKNSHIKRLSWDEKEDKAAAAIAYFLSMYKRYSNFYVERSFTGYLYLRVKFELYSPSQNIMTADPVFFVDNETLTKLCNEKQRAAMLQ